MLDKARRDDMSFMGAVMEGIFTVPGDGFIDYPSILRVLADDGYSGWLVVEAEQDPKKAHPLTYATMGFDNLSRLAKEAGFDGVDELRSRTRAAAAIGTSAVPDDMRNE